MGLLYPFCLKYHHIEIGKNANSIGDDILNKYTCLIMISCSNKSEFAFFGVQLR